MSDDDDEDPRGRLARTWSTFTTWAAKFFDKDGQESATWWFWGCLFDAVTFISMVQGDHLARRVCSRSVS